MGWGVGLGDGLNASPSQRSVSLLDCIAVMNTNGIVYARLRSSNCYKQIKSKWSVCVCVCVCACVSLCNLFAIALFIVCGRVRWQRVDPTVVGTQTRGHPGVHDLGPPPPSSGPRFPTRIDVGIPKLFKLENCLSGVVRGTSSRKYFRAAGRDSHFCFDSWSNTMEPKPLKFKDVELFSVSGHEQAVRWLNGGVGVTVYWPVRQPLFNTDAHAGPSTLD